MFTSVALMAALAAGSPAQMDHSAAYLALVQRFVPETADRVALELADWPEKTVGSAVEVLRGRGAVSPRVLLLELHTGISLLRHDRVNAGMFHLSIAMTLSRNWAAARASPDFYQPLYLAIVSVLQRRWLLAEAVSLLAGAEKIFPSNADLIVAYGSAYELAGSRFGQALRTTIMGLVPTAARASLALTVAREQYERALSLDPTNGEAALRLGRVQYLRRDVADARARLTRLQDRSAEPFVRYMAALFLGRIAQDEKHFADAARAYRAAAALYPHSQTAWIALSHVLHTSGAIADARRPIEMMIDTERPKSDRDDPWWQYHFGPDWRMDALTVQMWKEALR